MLRSKVRLLNLLIAGYLGPCVIPKTRYVGENRREPNRIQLAGGKCVDRKSLNFEEFFLFNPRTPTPVDAANIIALLLPENP